MTKVLDILLQDLEKTRQKYCRQFYMWGGVLVALLVSTMVMDILEISCIIGMMLFFYPICLDSYYKTEYQRKIMPEIVAQVLPDGHFEPHERIDTNLMKASGILVAHKHLQADGLLRFKSDNTPIELCNLHLEDEVRSGKSTHRVTRFNGCFIKAELPKAANMRAVMRKKESWLLAMSMVGLPPGLEKVELIAPNLTKHVEFYSNDQISVRKLFKPHFLAQLEDLFQRRPFYLSILGKTCFIAIDKIKLPMQPPHFLFKPDNINTKMSEFESFLQDIRAIVQELDITSKI